MSRFDRLINRASQTAGGTRRRAELAARGDRGPGFRRMVTSGILGVGAGAAASFLLDPARGRSRRARLLDQGAATVRRIGRQAEHAIRHVRSDAAGRIAAVRASRMRDARPLDDATLADRVQSTVFRDATLPKGDLNVNVERGIVVLRGEVPDSGTRERLVAEVEAIDGVWSVRDMLHLPGEEAVSVSA
ncbi:MAG TPA: BON domain-containing protein [Candidatus Limnocylindria bacterium]